ncbi:MAG: nucleotidyltransferase domain-containing protein [Deltaproteobacteria bacterium]|nr:nucleotidyltransferase domain-containing protein [Deltaproteobacteria bacterium]
MEEKDLAIIAEFKRRIPDDILNHVKRLILFGSRARGKASEDSDMDIVALVDEKSSAIENRLSDIVYSVMWDFNFKPIISLKVFSESRFKTAVERGFSFYKNVEREGIVL